MKDERAWHPAPTPLPKLRAEQIPRLLMPASAGAGIRSRGMWMSQTDLDNQASGRYGHEVLRLRLTEQGCKPLGKVAQVVIQTYNGDCHRTPPWSQVLLFFLIPQDVLSCYPPFQQVQT